MTRRPLTRPHLPSMLLGAVLGTVGLSMAGPRVFASADAALDAARIELHQIDTATQRMHPNAARQIRTSVARIDAAHAEVATSLDQARHRIQTLRARALTAEQALQTCESRPVGPPARPPHRGHGRPVAHGPRPVPPEDLRALTHALDQATWGRDQLALLRDMLPGRYFTVSQATQLVQQLSFERDQVEAAAMLYPHIVDRDQWYRMYAVFRFSSSQEALRARTTG